MAQTRGFIAGLATLVLCGISIVALFLAPSGELFRRPAPSVAQLASFTFVALLVIWLTNALRRARQEAELHAAESAKLRTAAEKSSAAYYEFVIALSHEIRTPVNGLLGTQIFSTRAPLGLSRQSKLRFSVECAVQQSTC